MARSSSGARSGMQTRSSLNLKHLSINRVVSGLGQIRDRVRSRSGSSERSGNGHGNRSSENPVFSQDPVQSLQNSNSQRMDGVGTVDYNNNTLATGSTGRLPSQNLAQVSTSRSFTGPNASGDLVNPAAARTVSFRVDAP